MPTMAKKKITDREALATVNEILDQLPDDAARLRVLRAVALLMGFQLEPTGDRS